MYSITLIFNQTLEFFCLDMLGTAFARFYPSKLEAIYSYERRERQRERERARHPKMLIDLVTNGPAGRPTGRENPLGLNLAQGPIMELNYQISSLTSEIRNLRDVMQALSNTHLFKHNPPGPGTDCGFK